MYRTVNLWAAIVGAAVGVGFAVQDSAAVFLIPVFAAVFYGIAAFVTSFIAALRNDQP